VQFTGKILEPKEFPDFNYKNYLSRFGIDAVVYYPNLDIIAENQGNWIKAKLLKVKENFVANLSEVLPEPQNGFAAALLVGNRRSIPQHLTDAFNATGTSHIVAISGYNITIIVWALDLALSRFGKRVSSLANVLVILGFIVITGAAASVIRAGVMAFLVILAKNIGRLYNPANALAASAAVMVAINPKLPLFDVGFQLSFLALVGLSYLGPIFMRWLSKVPDPLREVLAATLAAQIFALPILLYNFDQLSLVAPLTNILVLPLVGPTMLFGFLAGLSGFVWHALASLLAWPAWVLLSYILTVVQQTGAIPYASISVHINLLGMACYYIALGAFLFFYFGRRKIGAVAGSKVPLGLHPHTNFQ
jgi:competence protein ComEC